MSSSTLVPVLTSLLVSSRSADGGCDADEEAVIQVQRLQFRSLDEEMLIEAQLEERRRQQERDRWIGRAIGAGIGLFFGGMVDGFDAGDLTTGFVTGAMGGLAADGLNQLSDQELKEQGFAWATEPGSFMFHRRRHGPPRERVLVIAPAAAGEPWLTVHGVRFSDGYIALFSPHPLEGENPFMDGVHTLTGEGLTPDPHQSAQQLGPWPCSDGRQRPLEFVPTDAGNLLVMAVAVPHHSLY
jgi:hypothetical protein